MVVKIMNKKTDNSRLKTFLLIIIAVVFYMIALSIINALQLPYKGIIHLLLILVIAVCVYIFMQSSLYVYSCDITEDELIFTTKLGEAEKLIAKVSFNDISFVAPANSDIIKNKKRWRYELSQTNKRSF